MDIVPGHLYHSFLRWTHGKMIQIMTMVLARIAIQRIGQSIYNQFNGRIPDSVNSHLPTGIMNFV